LCSHSWNKTRIRRHRDHSFLRYYTCGAISCLLAICFAWVLYFINGGNIEYVDYHASSSSKWQYFWTFYFVIKLQHFLFAHSRNKFHNFSLGVNTLCSTRMLGLRKRLFNAYNFNIQIYVLRYIKYGLHKVKTQILPIKNVLYSEKKLAGQHLL